MGKRSNLFFIYLEFIFLLLAKPNFTIPSLNSLSQKPSPSCKSFRRNSPIIGVLTQPSAYPSYPSDEYSYIASSYVKDIESAGGRVIPLNYTDSKKKLAGLMKGLNGLFIPGGGTNLRHYDRASKQWQYTDWAQKAIFLMDLALSLNRKGVYFPVWGTCLGFELMLMHFSKDLKIKSRFHGNYSRMGSIRLLKNQTLREKSLILSNMCDEVENAMKRGRNLYYHHKYAIKFEKFKANAHLNKKFRILGTILDSNGTRFVAMAEAKKFPFFGAQFHPEKIAYEWSSKEPIKKGWRGLMIQQYFANFFIDEARKNPQCFSSSFSEYKKLISHFNPVYKYSFGMPIYFFHHKKLEPVVEKVKHSEEVVEIKQEALDTSSSEFSKYFSRQYIWRYILVLLVLMNLFSLWKFVQHKMSELKEKSD